VAATVFLSFVSIAIKPGSSPNRTQMNRIFRYLIPDIL
jgi:hypothetical protein